MLNTTHSVIYIMRQISLYTKSAFLIVILSVIECECVVVKEDFGISGSGSVFI